MTAAFIPLRWQAFRLWKQGNAEKDYEDAWAGSVPRGRFAIADGASEASFAATWARLLVENFVTIGGKPWRDLDWIEPLREQWAAQVDNIPLPWYAEEKRDLGAFATFLGLVFRPSTLESPGYWRVLAIGDCCLFQTRAGRLMHSFPMKRSADFGNRPRLLRSRTQGAEELESSRERSHGRWQAGDRFFLMTDALAQWFLLRTEQEANPLAEIDALLAENSPKEAFAGWVEERRERAVLRNDDVTLMVVNIAPK